jgi:anti-sigma B factor antagonist
MSSSQDIPDAAQEERPAHDERPAQQEGPAQAERPAQQDRPAQEERLPEADEVLDVRRETVGATTVLQVIGEIDTDTAPLFREHLATARRDTTAAAPLVVDLSGVTYMASPGLSVLIEAHNEHRRLHTRLLVVAGSRATRVPIMTTGLHAQLDVVITLAQALPSTT